MIVLGMSNDMLITIIGSLGIGSILSTFLTHWITKDKIQIENKKE